MLNEIYKSVWEIIKEMLNKKNVIKRQKKLQKPKQ